MATDYWVSYRVHKNATYEKRYDDLVEAIESASSKEWKETTSFHLITSDLDIDSLAVKLEKVIDPSVDRIVIRHLNNQTARCVGTFVHLSDLKVFMPYVKRV